MTQSQEYTPEHHYADDEIDLRDLVRAIWDTRVPVVAAVLLFAAVFWIGVGLFGAKQGVTYHWDALVQFSFTGVQDGEYPDESPFSSSDLLSPVVLRRVYEANNVEDYGLSRADFSEALSISAHAPNREFVVQRFRNRLAREQLSSAEIQELEEQFRDALDKASRGQARLSLTLRAGPLPRGGMLPEAIARKVLLDIPREWARYMTEEVGVFATDISLYSVDVLESSVLKNMDFLVAYDVLKDKFSLLSHNIEQLEELPNSANVNDPETGYRLSDIRALASELEEFVLQDTLSPTLATGVSRNPQLTIRFFRNRIDELRRQRDLMQTRAERVEQTLSDYNRSPQVVGGSAQGGLTLPEGMQGGGGTTIPQFGSDFLDRLVELGSDSGDIEFRQELSRERLDYTLQAAELESEIDRLARLIEMIEQQAAGEDAVDDGLDPDEMASELSTRMDDIMGSLRELFAASGRIAERMNELRYGSQEAIYNISKAPQEASMSAMILTRNNLMWFVLGSFLVAMVTVFGVFLVNMVKQRRES
ncbi:MULTISPECIES: hypothetical protein [unclassified Wenzhouxiangella]|uniref:hypothetical protein n=1 Tax=unclassified Wenzhouxiangella TaxID=2613841 RepID=UPI000E326089|nr:MULTISPECIES: hypothetical protein [unclassified Wenzhouxiangella]RFF27854.1 hypothetical protein DZK25_05580 [Wenzhouxiangella sp. 15181]RFP69019.1 hypothetical protein DZK26_05885 [Wenzhouxiangella sp. 15190]